MAPQTVFPRRTRQDSSFAKRSLLFLSSVAASSGAFMWMSPWRCHPIGAQLSKWNTGWILAPASLPGTHVQWATCSTTGNTSVCLLSYLLPWKGERGTWIRGSTGRLEVTSQGRSYLLICHNGESRSQAFPGGSKWNSESAKRRGKREFY